MSFKKPLNIGIAIGAAVLAVVVVVLIVYGVTTHSESGLLKVCWVDGQAHYVEGAEVNNGSCEGAEELVWPESQIPLTVTAITAEGVVLAPGASQREALDSAISDINSQVDFALLATIGDRAGIDIVVQVGAAVEAGGIRNSGARDGERSHPLGYARHHRANSATETGTILHCDIVVYSTAGGLREEYLVVHHELLHCVGLAHDVNNPASAIYPLTLDDTMLDYMQMTRITDFDRSLIRELYLYAPHDHSAEEESKRMEVERHDIE